MNSLPKSPILHEVLPRYTGEIESRKILSDPRNARFDISCGFYVPVPVSRKILSFKSGYGYQTRNEFYIGLAELSVGILT